MPATPSTRPSRIRPTPPARSSVLRILPPAPRAKSSAAIPQTAATGIAQTASRRRTPVVWRERATAAGTAATPARPSRTASEARWLLLRIRASDGGGRDRAADHAGDSDQGEHVRQGLEEHRRRVGVLGEPERERGRGAEEDRGGVRAERPPVAEDDRGEGNEAAAVRHPLVERADEADREVGAAERGEDARDGHGRIARLEDGDADGVGGAWVLADRTQPQPDGRPEEHDRRHDQQHEREPD